MAEVKRISGLSLFRLWKALRGVYSRTTVTFYIWMRMKKESGTFLLVGWEAPQKESFHYRIPVGTVLCDHKVERSSNHSIFNTGMFVIGNFEDLSYGIERNLFLVRIYPSLY